jgi:hypothetical protein
MNSEENTEQSAQGVAYQEPIPSGSDGVHITRKDGSEVHVNLRKVPVPLIIAAAYLLLGFLCGLWHPGWMLFFAIPVYYQLTAMAAAQTLRKRLNLFPMALLCVVFYLLLGFFLDLWHPGWIVFLLIPVYHTLVSTVFKK